MTEKYPLSWPTGWPRTPISKRQTAKFQVSFAQGRDELQEELERLGAWAVILSSNVELRRDGLPYANRPEPKDPGVAVYFNLGWGRSIKPHALACDRWLLVRDNIRAIGLHVGALRGVERWGVGSLEQAFSGYQALPESAGKLAWWEILKVSPDAPLAEIRACYKQLATLYHPDAGGSSDRMAELNRAYEEAQRSCLR